MNMEMLTKKVESLKEILSQTKALARELERHGLTLKVAPKATTKKVVKAKAKAKPEVKKTEAKVEAKKATTKKIKDDIF